jgi:predicted dehydrogenase
MTPQSLGRRSFLAAGAASLTAASYERVLGANERIGVGIIGYGLIGKRHVLDLKAQHDVDLVGVAEVHRGRRDEALAEIGGTARGHVDFRRLLEDRAVAAVIISTPDHWHALQTMLACAAGKDVYVEKPLTLFQREGRWMIERARRDRRVVQVGTQQRSGRHYQRACELIRQGHLGRIVSVSLRHARNITPGFGNPPDGPAPSELDWDLWLGPAPQRAYNPNRALYHFRWFWDYSGGQTTNLGAHSLDIVDWCVGLGSLRAVTSAGGRFCLRDNGETPDTQDALFELDGWLAHWSQREGAKGESEGPPLVFHGTRGSLGITRSGFQVTADPDVPATSSIPQFGGAHPVGGPRIVPVVGPARLRTEEIVDRTGDTAAQFREHMRDFLDCIRTRRQPRSDLESAHRTATACHLANLSLSLGRKLRWDAASETIPGDDEAVRNLTRPYRAPWDRELKALMEGAS